MADQTITAASVVFTGTTDTTDGTAGETITAGQPVYLDTGKLYRAEAGDTIGKAGAVGIAMHNAALDQPLRYTKKGTMATGNDVAGGEVYVVSETAGGIAPIGDLTSTSFVTVLGVGDDTNGTIVLVSGGVFASGQAVE